MDALGSWRSRLKDALVHAQDALERLERYRPLLTADEWKQLKNGVWLISEYASGSSLGVSAGVGYQGSVADLYAKQVPAVAAPVFNAVNAIARKVAKDDPRSCLQVLRIRLALGGVCDVYWPAREDGALVRVYEILDGFESAVKQAAAAVRHKRLYRYMRSDWVAEMLRKERMRLSPFTAFNDPLELRPWGYSDSPSVPSGWDIKSDPAETWALVEFEKRYRFLCLSRVACSPLMWAHYADSHRGVVLEFDVSDASFQGVGTLADIRYTATRPTGLLKNKGGYIPFFTKTPEWSYEREARIVARTQHCEGIQVGEETASFRPFPAAALRAVVFGYRCDAPRVAAIRKALVTSAYAHVKVKTASMDFNSYKIIYADV